MSRNRKPSLRMMDDSFDITTRRSLTENNTRKRKSQKVNQIKEKHPKQSETKNKQHTEVVTKAINEEDSKSTDGLHHILKDHNNVIENHCTKKKKHVKFDEKNIKQTKPDLENDKIESEELIADTAGKKIESVVRKLKSRPSTQNSLEDTVVKNEINDTVASISNEVYTNEKKYEQVSTRNRKNRATKCITKNDAAKTDSTELKKMSPENCDLLNKERISNTENASACNKIEKCPAKKPKKMLCKSINTKRTKTKLILEEHIKSDTCNILTRIKKTSMTKNPSNICTRKSFAVTQGAIKPGENSNQCKETLNDTNSSINIDINCVNKMSFFPNHSVQSVGLNVTTNRQDLGEENVNGNDGKMTNLHGEKEVQADGQSLENNEDTKTGNIDGCIESESNKTSENFNKKIDEIESSSCIPHDFQQADTNIVLTEPQGGYIEMCDTISESVLLKSTNKEVIDMKKTLNDTFDFESKVSSDQLNSCSDNNLNTRNEAKIVDVIQDNNMVEQTVSNDSKNVDLEQKNNMCDEETVSSSILTNIEDRENDVKSYTNLLDNKGETDVAPIMNDMECQSEDTRNNEEKLNISGVTSLDMSAATLPANTEYSKDNVQCQIEKFIQNTEESEASSSLTIDCTMSSTEIKKSASTEDCKYEEKEIPTHFSGESSKSHCGTSYIPSLLNLDGTTLANAEMKEVLNEHIKEEASSPGGNEVLYVCEDCEFETKIVTDFSYHYSLSHGQKNQQQTQDSDFCIQGNDRGGLPNGEVLTLYIKPDGTASCDTSNAMTIQPALKTRERKSRRLLVYDDSSGEELKMYQCGLCDFKTRYGKNLEVHYRLTHGLLLELFECSHPECHFVTFLRDSLFHHYRTQHVEVGVLVRTLQAPAPSAGK